MSTSLLMSYTYVFSAALMSQNGFFTDKGGHCAVKCCCAITGWGSFTREEWSLFVDISAIRRRFSHGATLGWFYSNGRTFDEKCIYMGNGGGGCVRTFFMAELCTRCRLLGWRVLTTDIREPWTVSRRARACSRSPTLPYKVIRIPPRWPRSSVLLYVGLNITEMVFRLPRTHYFTTQIAVKASVSGAVVQVTEVH